MFTPTYLHMYSAKSIHQNCDGLHGKVNVAAGTFPNMDPLQKDALLKACGGLYKPTGMSDSAYRSKMKDAFWDLKPVSSVMNAVNSFQSSVCKDYVGVHVRLGDSVDESSGEKRFKSSNGDLSQNFFNGVDQVLKERGSDNCVFLATDHRDVVTRFEGKYNSKVRTRFNKAHEFGQRDDVENALVDQILLAKSSTFIGSKKSTFTVLAALAGGHSLETARAFMPLAGTTSIVTSDAQPKETEEWFIFETSEAEQKRLNAAHRG